MDSLAPHCCQVCLKVGGKVVSTSLSSELTERVRVRSDFLQVAVVNLKDGGYRSYLGKYYKNEQTPVL